MRARPYRYRGALLTARARALLIFLAGAIYLAAALFRAAHA